MFYVNQPKPMTPFWIFTTLLLALLTAWGCDHSVEMPTAESVETIGPVEMESDVSIAAAPRIPARLIPQPDPRVHKDIPVLQVALNLYWSGITGDYLTIATPIEDLGAPAQGHEFQAIVGHIFPVWQPDTVPLMLFWNMIRKDFLTIAAKNNTASLPGYVFVRIEGFVFPNQQHGTVPLKLFWNAEQEDYLTTTGAAPKGYEEVRIEGFVNP